jgi:recombination protein RecT
MKSSENQPSQTELQLTQKLSSEVAVALQTAFRKCVNLIGKDEALRELGFAQQIIAKSPTLQKCGSNTIIDAVVNASRANVTLNPALRLAYLVPRKGAATLDISYMGLITILKKSGGCKYVDAFIVYQDEDFNYNPALGTIQHTPHFATTEAEQKARKMIGCYSRAVLPSNDTVFCYMPYWEIEKIKRFSEGSESKWSAWTTWEEEMVKKSVIKRHFKMLVSGTEAAEVVEALRIEEENNPLVKQPTKSSLFDLDFE